MSDPIKQLSKKELEHFIQQYKAQGETQYSTFCLLTKYCPEEIKLTDLIKQVWGDYTREVYSRSWLPGNLSPDRKYVPGPHQPNPTPSKRLPEDIEVCPDCGDSDFIQFPDMGNTKVCFTCTWR